MIFLNFKLYPSASDQQAVKLAQLAQQVSQVSQVKINLCPQASDIYQIHQAVDLELWAQHVDPVESDKRTGWISPLAVKQDGAVGTMLNHAEHPLEMSTLKQTLSLCRQHQLKVIICSPSLDFISQLNPLHPDYIAFEDPALIGGSVSMIQAHPDQVQQAVKLAQSPLIVGGGMRTGDHVKQALSFGAAGVLVASEVAQSDNPQASLQDLVSAFA